MTKYGYSPEKEQVQLRTTKLVIDMRHVDLVLYLGTIPEKGRVSVAREGT
jgi:hypothetical protein